MGETWSLGLRMRYVEEEHSGRGERRVRWDDFYGGKEVTPDGVLEVGVD